MLRTASMREPAQKSPSRVGASTRSTRSAASKSNRPGRGEPIEMQEKRFGYFPQRFRWRGSSISVQAVERCWTKPGRAASSAQMCFRVRCGEGTFELTHNVKHNIWTLSIVT